MNTRINSRDEQTNKQNITATRTFKWFTGMEREFDKGKKKKDIYQPIVTYLFQREKKKERENLAQKGSFGI